MTELPWYVAFFGDDYLDAYGHTFSLARAEREVAFVQHTLDLHPGDRLLDLCCGQGRHAVLLASRGLRVTGQDLNAEYLRMAGRAAAAQHVELETVCRDMREIPFERQFDAVVNLFSAFGYLESEAEDRKVLVQIAKALKPGGRVLLDLVNREWVIANPFPNEWHTDDRGRVYLEHREVDLLRSRNHVTFTIVEPDGTRRESVGHHFRLYTLTEMHAMLASAGLEFMAVYGDFDGTPYAAAARRMIV
ncbi:MAG: class I SAM-dependent methyltransferase, partial [Gemmatimonadaceae bacterium]